MKLDFDVIVVGAGMSGMTAAIYLKRSNVSVAIIEDTAPGGQINRTSRIENYPGFSMIDGPTLAFNVFTQVQNLGIPYKYGKVLEVIDEKDYKIIKTNKEELKCKAVIIATGRRPKEIGLPNEKNLIGKGISWCAICDGPLYKDIDVAIVGSDRKALEEANFLSSMCSKVTIVSNEPVTEFDRKDNVEVIDNAVVISLNELDGKLDSIDISIGKEEKNIKVKGLFVYLGSVPVSDMLENTGVEIENGYIVVDRNMKTNVDGIYACGDVIKKEFYQISTAVGEGAIAALSVVKYLK